MLSIAVCDDEVIECCNMAKRIKKIMEEMKIPCIIRQFRSGGELLQALESFDIVFLDIIMQELDGMKTAKIFREKASDQILIFVSSSREYVFEAYDVEAFQYLLKPVDEERFADVFGRAVQSRMETSPRKRMLTIQYAGVTKTIPLDQIYYMESQNHKIVIHHREGELEYYAKMGDLEKELQGQFFRVHKGYLINLAFVDEYSRTEVTLASGDRILISKYKYQDFTKAYLRFMQ